MQGQNNEQDNSCCLYWTVGAGIGCLIGAVGAPFATAAICGPGGPECYGIVLSGGAVGYITGGGLGLFSHNFCGPAARAARAAGRAQQDNAQDYRSLPAPAAQQMR